MKTIDKLSFVPLLALLLFAGSCEKDGGVFMRENELYSAAQGAT